MFEIIWNSIVDHIPLWGWFLIVGIPAGVLLYFFGGVLLPVWRLLPAPVRGVLIAIGVGAFAYLGGRWKGRRNAEDEQKHRDANALKTRADVDARID